VKVDEESSSSCDSMSGSMNIEIRKSDFINTPQNQSSDLKLEKPNCKRYETAKINNKSHFYLAFE
jgi:hypothetical protein